MQLGLDDADQFLAVQLPAGAVQQDGQLPLLLVVQADADDDGDSPDPEEPGSLEPGPPVDDVEILIDVQRGLDATRDLHRLGKLGHPALWPGREEVGEQRLPEAVW